MECAVVRSAKRLITCQKMTAPTMLMAKLTARAFENICCCMVYFSCVMMDWYWLSGLAPYVEMAVLCNLHGYDQEAAPTAWVFIRLS